MASNYEDPKLLHRLIRTVAGIAVASFFTEVRIKGEENVPQRGPIIVTATHHNMMLDPVVLSVGFPYARMLNYWSKASLFKNPVMKKILLSSGNIPVDRKSKDRQVLFKGTIEALAAGGAVALFPEGTSYTEPRIMQVKDGAAWAAMEYTRWKQTQPNGADLEDVVIVPASIVYTNKSKYRSGVVMEFGRPISVETYKEQFFSEDEGAPRAAVKRLTRAIEGELVETSINAPNWDILYVARMAREILWVKERSINLDDFVEVSQTLVDMFTRPDTAPNIKAAKRHLLAYYGLLQSSHLTHSVLSTLPLPRNLDPNTSATVPSRVYTLLILIRDSIAALIQLPFVFLPLLVHTPVYIMGRIGARLVEDEEETQAQNKVAFGLISSLLIYPAAFTFLWALFRYSTAGGLLAGLMVYLFAVYHIKIIDDNYQRAKRFIAAWRILLGVWAPKQWDMSLSAVGQYMTPRAPAPSPWVERPAEPTPTVESEPEETSVGKRRGRRPPSRRLVRHVLRARVEAVNALAGFLDQLSTESAMKRVYASKHLAERYGDGQDSRYASEVLAFLQKRGAVLPSLNDGPLRDRWAGSSDDGWTTGEDTK